MTGMEHAIKHAARVIQQARDAGAVYDDAGEPLSAAETIARALAEAGLLVPAPLTEEWAAVVGWANAGGQTEQNRGYGDTRDAALANARGDARLLGGMEEVAHKTVRRWVSEWGTP